MKVRIDETELYPYCVIDYSGGYEVEVDETVKKWIETTMNEFFKVQMFLIVNKKSICDDEDES